MITGLKQTLNAASWNVLFFSIKLSLQDNQFISFSLLKSLRLLFSALYPDDLAPYFIKRESSEVGTPCFLLPNLSVDLHLHIFLSFCLMLQQINCSSPSQCQISCLCSVSPFSPLSKSTFSVIISLLNHPALLLCRLSSGIYKYTQVSPIVNCFHTTMPIILLLSSSMPFKLQKLNYPLLLILQYLSEANLVKTKVLISTSTQSPNHFLPKSPHVNKWKLI